MSRTAPIEPIATRARDERGTAVIEGLLAFGLVMLVVALAVQAVAYVHTRSVAQTAAQEGARRRRQRHRSRQRARQRRPALGRRRRIPSAREDRDER